jgi:membrane-associated phospholipid phosphatase
MLFVRIFLSVFFLFSTAQAWDLTDLKTEASSPFYTSARNVIIVGGGLTLGVLLFEDAIVDPTQKEFANNKPLGNFSKLGNLGGQFIPNALYVLGQSAAGAAGNKNGYSRAIGMLKASAYAASVTTALKYAIREPRPDQRSERDSFPSGHSTSAFAFSGYVFEEHGWKWGVPALLLSTFVGASRMNDNRHYLHDVIAGATIGLAYGIGISKVDKMKPIEERPKSDFSIFPIFDGDMKGIAFRKEF